MARSNGTANQQNLGSQNLAPSMRAVVQRRYGSTETWSVDEVPRPAAGGVDAGGLDDHEVLVEVRAAGLDRGTWHLMVGEPYVVRPMFGLTRPRNPTPGSDVAGVVAAIGSKVTRFAVGDEVYGTGRGTFAEYCVAKESKLSSKPARLSFEQAAATPVSGSTALQGLVDVGKIESGQRVLITGASGGVGSFAIQVAKAHGAHVTAIASTAKLDFVRSLGADAVVAYDGAEFYDDPSRPTRGGGATVGSADDRSSSAGKYGSGMSDARMRDASRSSASSTSVDGSGDGVLNASVFEVLRQRLVVSDGLFDLVLDIAGNPSLSELRSVLTTTGTAVIVGGEGAGRLLGIVRQLRAVALSPFIGQRLTMFLASDDHEPLDRLGALIESDDVTPVVDRTLGLDGAADAMRHLVKGSVRGKLVIVP